MNRGYPKTVQEILKDITYKRETIKLNLVIFKDSKTLGKFHHKRDAIGIIAGAIVGLPITFRGK